MKVTKSVTVAIRVSSPRPVSSAATLVGRVEDARSRAREETRVSGQG